MSQSKKISELNELNSGDIADNDEFVLNDSSEPETKKFTWSSLKESIDIQVQNYQAGDGLTLVNNETFSVNVSDLAGSGLQDDGSNNLELINDSITVAGNTVSLGGSISINHNDLSAINSDDHHARYTDSEAITAINNDIDHGSTANHNYFSGDYTDLINKPDVAYNTSIGLTDLDSYNHNDLLNIDGGTYHLTSAEYTELGNILDSLTSAEITQLGNINTETISNTQWGYLGDLDQSLTTTSNVNFGELTLSSEANIAGIEEEVSDKNKKQVYLTNGTDNIFVNINSVWNGASYDTTEGLGVGKNALQNNTGNYSNGFGHNALLNNTGNYSNGFGYKALRYNAGELSNGFGYKALRYNAGNYSNGFGLDALKNNAGDYSNGV